MLRNYRFPLLIITGVVIGAAIGLIFGESAAWLKPELGHLVPWASAVDRVEPCEVLGG